MADIKISDLQNATMASDGSDLFEISQGQGGGSRLSKSVSAAQIGNFVNAVQTYSGLGGLTPVAAIASKPNGKSVFTGTADPAAALGNDGDIYIKYNPTTSTVIDVKMYKPTDAYTVEITISEGGNDLLFESNACSLFGGYSTITDTFTTADGNSHTINSWGVEHRGDNDPSQFVEIDGTTISFVTTGMNSSYEIDETKTMTFAPPDKECVIYTKISGTWEDQIDTEDIKTLLSDLNDVNTSQLANGDVLVWNSTGGTSGNGGWENKSITADDVEYTSGVSVGDKLDEIELETLTNTITAVQGVTLEQKSLYKQGKMAIMSFVLRVPNINGTILTFTDIFPKETYFNTVKDNDNVIPYLKIERTSTGGRLVTDVTKTTNGLVIGEIIFIVD